MKNNSEYNDEGIDIMSKDWDNLIILDACRYDSFAARSDLPGNLEKYQSRGACTGEWLQGNFAGKTYPDTVYVTANPQFAKRSAELEAGFHDVLNVWQEDGWDSFFNTVLPSTVLKYAKRANERYPSKRLLVHFLQPHAPFLTRETTFDKDERGQGEPLWDRAFRGELDISEEMVTDLYKENLDAVLPYADYLLHELPGRNVVTSDHGQVFGERSYPLPIKEWGHPWGVYTEELVDVPWLVYQNGSRKTVKADTPESNEDENDMDVVEDRLRQLGYK